MLHQLDRYIAQYEEEEDANRLQQQLLQRISYSASPLVEADVDVDQYLRKIELDRRLRRSKNKYVKMIVI